MNVKFVRPPSISDAEYEALEGLDDYSHERCRLIRPDTMGYQKCWRLANHDGPHRSGDNSAWKLVP